MTRIVVQLLDEKNKVCEKKPFNFNQQTTFKELQDYISSVFAIKTECQYICYESQEIGFTSDPESTLSEIGVKDKDITVQHSDVDMWNNLVKACDEFKITYEEEARKVLYDSAVDAINRLNENDFYDTYTNLLVDGVRIYGTFLKAYDRTRQAMENTARTYFEKLYHDKDPNITFRDRKTRPGCVCEIEINGQITTYYIKTHHNAGNHGSSMRYNVDLKELFVYKLLEKLGVGAKITFLTNSCGSRWTIYIASEKIANFKTIEMIEQTHANNKLAKSTDLEKYVNPAIQMLALYTIMELSDYNSDNIGIDADGSPFILDFSSVLFKYFDVRVSFYEEIYSKYDKTLIINELIKVKSLQERVSIAQQFFGQLNLASAIDNTLESFLADSKKLFDDEHLVFENDRQADDLKSYVQKVKENLQEFVIFNE